MTTIGYAVLEIIPSLRGVSDALDKGTRNLKITPQIDTSGAGKAGQQAGRDVQAGMDSEAKGGLRRFLTFDGARSAGQQAGGEVNTGLQSADIGQGVSSSLNANLVQGAESTGRNLGSLIASGLKATAVAGGVLAAAGIGAALRSGFSRLTAIDDAKFKLQGLGNSTEKVQTIMDNALAAVKGTAFGLDEAATTAASAVAAGIEPGQKLTDYLKLTADTAAIAGTSLADMGSIFNKVQTSGKAFTGDLNQLADRGLPVFTWLQEATGKTGEEFDKFVQDGGVSAELFQTVVADRISGAAQKMGGSITGNLANLKASTSRFGAELAAPILAGLGPLSTAVTAAFDKVTAAIKPVMGELSSSIGTWATDLGAKITAWLDGGGVEKITGFISNLSASIKGLSTGQGRSDALSSITESVKALGPALQNAGPALQGVGDAMKAFGQAIIQVGPDTLSSVLVPAMNLLAGALKFVADNASWAVPTIVGLVGAFMAFRAVGEVVGPIVSVLNGAFRVINAPLMLAQTAAIRQQAAAMTQLSVALGVNTAAQAENTVAQNVGAASTIRGRIAAVGAAIAQKAIAVALGVWTAAQWLLNAALDANPIGLIVIAIAAFVAGIIYAYNHSETFRKIVQGAWEGIKAAAGAVVSWFTDTAWPFLKKVWEGISAGWTGLVATAEEVWNGIRTRFTQVVDFFRGLPAAIGTAASGMWEGLKNGLVEVLRWIADKWNKLTDSLSFDIPDWVPVVGGKQWHLPKIPQFATGGYTGSIPIDQVAGVVHGGEHVINAGSRTRIENAYPGLLDFMNNNGKLPLPGYAAGGLVTTNQLTQFASGLEGKPYVWGGTNWGDCSGAMSAIANYATGRPPFASRFATGTEAGELASRGFKSGVGPAGSLSIGWYNGGPYGGHTAGTLPDGTHVEMGGRRGNGQFGGGAAGANDPEFTDHAHLPPEFFSGLDGGAPTRGDSGATAPPSSSGSGGGGGGGGSGGGSSTTPTSGGSSGSGFSLASSFSGLSSFGLDGLGAGVGTTGSGSDLGLFGKAAGTAVSGQVTSALGVLGIGDAPPILKAASQLIGGIKIGGGGGGASPLPADAAAPLSATSSAAGALLPDGEHGTRAGQSPGPTYNIQARDTEDAFIRAQRIEKEKAAAKLSRY